MNYFTDLWQRLRLRLRLKHMPVMETSVLQYTKSKISTRLSDKAAAHSSPADLP